MDTSWMKEMALKSVKQKKQKCCPCLPLSSQQEDVPGEQEEEARLLYLFGDYLDYLETPTKTQEKVKVKTKKRRKKWKAEKKKKHSFFMEKENVVLCEGSLNDEVLKRDKCLRESKDRVEESNCLGSDKKGLWKEPDSSIMEFLAKKKGKKAKALHDSEHIDGSQVVFRETKPKQYYKTRKAVQKSHSTKRKPCLPLSSAPYVSERGKQKGLSHQETPWLQMPWKRKALDSTVHYFRGSIIKGFKQNRKLHKEDLPGASTTEVNSSASSTEALVSSPSTTLEIKTCSSEEEPEMRELKAHVGSDLEEISSSFNSQELFVTQQPCFPLQSASSSLHPHPPQDAQEATLKQGFNGSCFSNPLKSSRVSAERKASENCFQLTPCSLTPSSRRESFSVTRECAVQTDDFFSSSAVAASLIIKREFVDCHEQPLDLSMPDRIQSTAACAEMMSHHLERAGEGIHVSPRCTMEPAMTALNDERENLTGSQSRKSDDIKYIQMHLNSSYFFKLKGNADATVPGAPLVKLSDPVFGTSPGKPTLEKRKKK